MKTLECSSKGDQRFSAFRARVTAFGRTDSIENHYQLCKRFGDTTPATWREAKGKKPTHISLNGTNYDVELLGEWYKLLWVKYLDEHPELVGYAQTFDHFTDMFRGNSVNCQADVIEQYVKGGRSSVLADCQRLLHSLRS